MIFVGWQHGFFGHQGEIIRSFLLSMCTFFDIPLDKSLFSGAHVGEASSNLPSLGTNKSVQTPATQGTKRLNGAESTLNPAIETYPSNDYHGSLKNPRNKVFKKWLFILHCPFSKSCLYYWSAILHHLSWIGSLVENWKNAVLQCSCELILATFGMKYIIPRSSIRDRH